jgi:hypothetical protein
LQIERPAERVALVLRLKEITKTKEYKDIHACLNIHELLAIGLSNKVFDERVAYHYWSAAMMVPGPVTPTALDPKTQPAVATPPGSKEAATTSRKGREACERPK